jgi:hypothetical protein
MAGKKLMLHELPHLTERERDFVASVTSDPGQAPDFTEGFERLVEAVSESRAEVKRLRGVLVDIEWRGRRYYDAELGEEHETCPACDSCWNTHNDDCPLRAALAHAEDALTEKGGE